MAVSFSHSSYRKNSELKVTTSRRARPPESNVSAALINPESRKSPPPPHLPLAKAEQAFDPPRPPIERSEAKDQ